MKGTPEYEAWHAMKQRCNGTSVRAIGNYFNRGIRVCDEWVRDFAAFYAHVGPKPSSKHSLDRIDNDGNYEPGNVRWATSIEQNNNRRDRWRNHRRTT